VLHRALGLAALGALVTLTLACGGSSGSEGVPSSFYIEAAVEVTDHEGESPRSEIRWWFEPPGRWRWEIENDRGLFFGLSDGETLWIYDPVGNTYSSAARGRPFRGTRRESTSSGAHGRSGPMTFRGRPYTGSRSRPCAPSTS